MAKLEFLFIAALVFYTIAIFANLLWQDMRRWMVVIFGTGLLCDAMGTLFLCFLTATGWQWTAHSISGTLALIIMTVHFIWAVASFYQGSSWEAKFRHWSVWAWLLWLAAFVSGIPVGFGTQLLIFFGILVGGVLLAVVILTAFFLIMLYASAKMGMDDY